MRTKRAKPTKDPPFPEDGNRWGEELYMAKNEQAERFHAGTLTDGWRWFGAHPEESKGRQGWLSLIHISEPTRP